MRVTQICFFIFSLVFSAYGIAGQVTLPHVFKSGEKAVAAHVNENMQGLANQVNDNDNRLVAMQTIITNLQATVSALQSQLNAIQVNSALQLDGVVFVEDDEYGNRRVLISGANLQVVNGVSQDELTGTGNIIIGYNRARDASVEVCSDGAFIDKTSCESNGQIWALNHRSGSHNLVGGNNNSYSSSGGMIFGSYGAINRKGATVSGGFQNIASGFYSHVSAGYDNRASNDNSSVSGGYANKASGTNSSVSGGQYNTASGIFSAVTGGLSNSATVDYSAISGGESNTTNAYAGYIGGGLQNEVLDAYAAILGGQNQATSAWYQTIPALP